MNNKETPLGEQIYWLRFLPTNTNWKNEFQKFLLDLQLNIEMAEIISNTPTKFKIEIICTQNQFSKLKSFEGFQMGGESTKL